ncbi:hypothetical protein ACX93W_21925 [Paenibacillus sp. CAU 1782]
MIDVFVENVKDSDERYKCYTLKNAVQIFNQIICDENLDDVRIYISTEVDLYSISPNVESYINWFTQCETIVRHFYENELQHKTPQNWFNEIEVYNVDITFNSCEDYGATITCGDNILQDHILSIDFDREQISVINING